MDINTILLILLVLACPLMMFFMKGHKHNNMGSNRKSVYICPMHPDVVSNERGKCPKCGMNLEPREK